MHEKWLPVVGFEGRYEVSNLGRLRSLNYRGHSGVHLMKVTPNYAKYNTVVLADRKQYRVACLVLQSFVGPRPSPQHQACHGPAGNTVDRLDNLRWDTREANIAERTSYAGENNPNSKLTNNQMAEIIIRRSSGEKLNSLSSEYDVSPQRVCQIAKGI